MKDIPDSLMTIGLVAVGVIVAGYVMNLGYNKLGILTTASDGFDK